MNVRIQKRKSDETRNQYQSKKEMPTLASPLFFVSF